MKKMVVPFEVKQITEDEDYFVFEGLASTFGNIDRGMDSVQSGAFREDVAELMAGKRVGKLPVLWQHDQAMPIGSYTELTETTQGLYVKGRLPKTDTFVSGRVVPQMKAESVTCMSIGYSTIDYVIEGGVRLLKKLKLWEISLVTTPMNPLAEITGIKSAVPYQDLPLASREREWSADAALARVKPFLDSAEEPAEAYRKAFLWYDADNSEDFGAYKLPIADVIDGTLTAIPRAIFAAAAALSGARGGVDIPEDDRGAVIASIDRYYAKMDLESPFNQKSSFRLDELTILTERDLEKLFKSGVSFTNQTSKRLASALKAFLRDEEKSGNRDDSVGSAVVDELKSLLELAKTLTSNIEGK
jgi:HK97 family phage prohead protease